MHRTGSRAAGIILASVCAGPVFVISVCLATLYGMLPRPMAVSAETMGLFAALLAASLPFGGVIAILPNLFGTLVMAALAESEEWARTPCVWMLAGAVIGLGIALPLGTGDPDRFFAFGFVITSAISARLCRTFLRWTD